MTTVFHHILQFGIQAGFLVLAIIALRLLLNKAPKSLICALWALVAVRLVFPFNIQSIFSLIPRTENITRTVGDYAAQTVTRAVSGSTEGVLVPPTATTSGATVSDVTEVLPLIASVVWIAGVCAMLIYAAVSYLKLYRLTRESVMVEKGVYLCDRVASPFILGMIRPKIFLPSNISEHDKPYVLAHERAHIKRRDHLWKPLGFLLLSVYWFNPLLWVAYVLLCKDIELACDEKVIRELGYDVKKPYAIALVNAAAPRRRISACPLAFGETSVKARVKKILNYKKPAFWIIIIAVVLSIAVAVCFLTNPIREDNAATDQVSGDLTTEYVWSSFGKEPSDYGYVDLRVENNTGQNISVDMSNFRLFKNEELLTPKSSNDTQYYEYINDGQSNVTSFSLYPYLNELDMNSTFRLEADCYIYNRYAVNANDSDHTGETADIKTVAGTISATFRFPERGDIPFQVIDIIYHDIDGDGTDEMLVLSPGPTSGITSYTVGAYDKDTYQEKYRPTTIGFYHISPDEHCLTVIDGQAVLVGYEINPDNPEGETDWVVYAIIPSEGELSFQEISREQEQQPDLSDIDNLTVGSEMPSLTYVDDTTAVFDGDCGVVLYDMTSEQVIARLSLKELRARGFSIPYSSVSADGSKIYIFDYADDGKNDDGNYRWAIYDVQSGLLSFAGGKTWPLTQIETFGFDSQKYNIQYGEDGINLSTKNYVKGDTQYVLSVPGWKLANMELTVKNLTNNTEKTYKIFE